MSPAFLPQKFCTTVAALCELIDGVSEQENSTVEVAGFASLRDARSGDVTFFQDARHADALKKTRASVVLVPSDWTESMPGVVFIRVASPTTAFERVVNEYGWKPTPPRAGVHPTAAVAPSASYDPATVSIGANAVVEEGAIIAEGVSVGAGCYVGRDTRIGAGSQLHAHAVVQDGCSLGERVILHSGVVIGADGFGYEFEGGRFRKVQQRGTVQIDSNVEIGANSTVDRARFGRTWIGEGTKIDNLVQIGHNVIIGKNCMLVAGVAIAGSAVIEDFVVVGAQVGITGHVTVGAQARLGARSGVTKDLAGGRTYLGFPAVSAEKEKRKLALLSRLGRLYDRVQALETKEA